MPVLRVLSILENETLLSVLDVDFGEDLQSDALYCRFECNKWVVGRIMSTHQQLAATKESLRKRRIKIKACRIIRQN